jgi:Phage terminase large subunit
MPVSVNKTFRVYPKQRTFTDSKKLLRAFVGGIGSGKSKVGSFDMIRRSKQGRLYMVTAPTYPMLSDSTFRSFTEVAHELGAASDVKSSAPPSVKLVNGAEVLFRSTDNPDTLRGPNLSGVWMDEASLSARDALDVLLGRLREGGEQGWLAATFTPKGKLHWTYKVFANPSDPDVELVHATSAENPFLPPGFVDKLKLRYTEAQGRQELGGVFLEGAGNHYFPHLWPRYADVGDAYFVREGAPRRHYLKSECCTLLALDWAMGKPKSSSRERAAALVGTGERRGDHTAFVVADMTGDGYLLYRYCLNERIALEQNAPRLAEVCRRYRPVVVAGDDDNLSEALSLECRRHPDIPVTKPMALGGRNKLVRSQAAIVRAGRGMMLLPQGGVGGGADWVETMSDQLASFTGADGEPDDVADAVSIMGRLADEFFPGEATEDFEPILGSQGYDGGGMW